MTGGDEQAGVSQAGPTLVLSPQARLAVEARLKADRRAVEDALDRLLGANGVPPTLHEAMRYSVFAGGKRLRPLLVIAAAEVGGTAADAVLPAACAVELVHTYSLVHDDLPAMDDSPTRRGRPTCHVVYGDAVAVLAGDGLQALGFDLLAQNAGVPGMAPDRVVRAIAALATGIGARGMVGGQTLDLLAARDRSRDVREIHRLKTGALIEACLRIGGLLGGASDAALEALARYGAHVGLAFQIVDDLLDVLGDEAALGKHTGSDAAQAKLTFPGVFGVTAARELAHEATAQAVLALEPLGARGRWLHDLAIYLLTRDR
jgi:geranylgeranyl diphosphate synthase type II